MNFTSVPEAYDLLDSFYHMSFTDDVLMRCDAFFAQHPDDLDIIYAEFQHEADQALHRLISPHLYRSWKTIRKFFRNLPTPVCAILLFRIRTTLEDLESAKERFGDFCVPAENEIESFLQWSLLDHWYYKRPEFHPS